MPSHWIKYLKPVDLFENFPKSGFFFFFNVDHLIGFVTVSLLNYVLVFWPLGMWDPQPGTEPLPPALEGLPPPRKSPKSGFKRSLLDFEPTLGTFSQKVPRKYQRFVLSPYKNSDIKLIRLIWYVKLHEKHCEIKVILTFFRLCLYWYM